MLSHSFSSENYSTSFPLKEKGTGSMNLNHTNQYPSLLHSIQHDVSTELFTIWKLKKLKDIRNRNTLDVEEEE